MVMMRSHSRYHPLSPYYLADSDGRLMENLWQAAKVYPEVPSSRQVYSRWDSRVIWEHPAERHLDAGKTTPKYWAWRAKLERNPDAVRYPVGMSHRHRCRFALSSEGGPELDYLQSRRAIYLPLYVGLAKQHPLFAELRLRLSRGESLLIAETDGPHQESLDYYRERYGVPADFISQGSVLATEYNLKILLDDSRHPFGHGYCLAAALLGIDSKLAA
ncbi:MAG: hypothetical protein ACYCOU_01930 [Sulfobacillus sp.]